jgi:serine/threonine protein kinase
VQEKFSSPEARNELHAQVDAFMNAVHEICLHGDIKLGNVMINNTGQLYLIDFGQSLHVRNMEEKTRDQFENIMAHEREQMRICLQRLFNEIQQRPIEKVAA